MASIDISEADFTAIAGAAITAQLSGDQPLAEALDKFARKISAALVSAQGIVAVEWTDVPSVLEAFNRRTRADNIVAFRTPTRSAEMSAEVTWSRGAAPDVKAGREEEFVVAVYRARTGKVHSFAASYLNDYPLEYRDGCPNREGCDGCGCNDGCPTTGWFVQTGDGDGDASLYNPLSLHDGDRVEGWARIPQWPSPALPTTAVSGESNG